jgi:hypothetical protein
VQGQGSKAYKSCVILGLTPNRVGRYSPWCWGNTASSTAKKNTRRAEEDVGDRLQGGKAVRTELVLNALAWLVAIIDYVRKCDNHQSNVKSVSEAVPSVL